MRRLLNHRWIAPLSAMCWSVFSAVAVFAQTQPDPIRTTTRTTTTWYTEPWVLPVGIAVAVFLIVVIALTNRGSSSRSGA